MIPSKLINTFRCLDYTKKNTLPIVLKRPLVETLPYATRLFTYYNLYRIVIGALLFGATFTLEHSNRQLRHPDTYQFTTLAYLILNLSIFFYFKIATPLKTKQIIFAAALDIFILHALFFLGKGVTGSIGNLVIITLAASNIMLRGKSGLALAAIASLVTLGVEIDRVMADISSVASIARAGLMGAIYFAVAYIVQNLSHRISQSESLAIQQQQDILELQKLNHQVIQRMRTGIVVCDDYFNVRTVNQACRDLIGLANEQALPDSIKSRIAIWRDNKSIRTTPFRVGDDYPIVQVNFSLLSQEGGDQTLVFIEDTRLLTQQAQQLKLASLGRLTASIAHEVRNPLGAISHATQLLNESENIDSADQKMIDIIQRHCQRVNLIIENTLSLSRRDEPKTEELELSEWLSNAIDDYREHKSGSGSIQLSSDERQPRARFDPNQIEQVLVNLLDNGIRHGLQHNKDAVLTVHLSQTDNGEQAIIDIVNEGPLISEEVKAHLFEPFFTTETQGTGLGLYLSKEICEANQAQLDYIDSIEGKVCFRIRFAHAKRII